MTVLMKFFSVFTFTVDSRNKSAIEEIVSPFEEKHETNLRRELL